MQWACTNRTPTGKYYVVQQNVKNNMHGTTTGSNRGEKQQCVRYNKCMCKKPKGWQVKSLRPTAGVYIINIINVE